MPRKYQAKPKKLWNDNALKQAVNESIQTGTSLQNLEEKYSIPRSTLHFHITLRKNNLQPKNQGCKPVFTQEQCEELKVCITDLAELGFAPSMKDLREIVGTGHH